MNLRVKDVADLVSVSEKTIYRMIKGETIPCFRVGGQWRFDHQEIISWLERGRGEARHISTGTELIEDEEGISITDFLFRGGVFYNVKGSTKDSAILSSLKLIKRGITLPEIKILFNGMMAREKLCSTAIGHGIAFPHPRPFKEFTAAISSISLCFLMRPIPFNALDNEYVDTLFFIFPRSERRHVRIFTKLSRMLNDDEVKSAIKKALPKDKLMQVFASREAKIFRRLQE